LAEDERPVYEKPEIIDFKGVEEHPYGKKADVYLPIPVLCIGG
jgi:hypothetical protein